MKRATDMKMLVELVRIEDLLPKLAAFLRDINLSLAALKLELQPQRDPKTPNG